MPLLEIHKMPLFFSSLPLPKWLCKNFARYLLSRLFATISIQMQSVAVAWQLYESTGSVFDLGLIGLFHFVPFFLLVLIGGQVADRYNRHILILICLFAQLLCGALLLCATVVQINMTWPLFTAAAVLGSIRAFLMPATQAILTSLVSPANVKKAVALGSSTFQLSIIVGPALGGLIYLHGPSMVYGVVVGLLALSTLLMLLVHLNPRVMVKRPTSWRRIFEGFQFVQSKPIIWGALSLDLFAVFFGGATALLPAYVRDILQAGPNELGFLRMAPAIGAMLTATAFNFWPITRRVGFWMFGGVAVFGIGSVMLGLSHNFPLALIALILIGSGDMVSVYIRQILIQCGTPENLRGRVSALNSIFIGTSNELGEFESGVTASWFGLTRALVLGGVMALTGGAFWAWRFPILRQLDRFPQNTSQRQEELISQNASPNKLMANPDPVK